MRTVLLTLMIVGCGEADMLPLVDTNGDLAGSFDPATGELRVGDDPSAIESQDGDQIAVSGGLATVDWTLVPGDELLLVDGAGEAYGALTVEDPALLDDLSEDQAETRFGACTGYL